MTAHMTSGFGQYHTNEDGKANRKPYSSIDLAGIEALVDNPQQVDKSKAQWVIPSTLATRTFKDQEDYGEYWLLWADLDQNPKPLLEVSDILIDVIETLVDDFNFEIYTSKSAQEINQKSRILIPLGKALPGPDWVICQQILNDKLEASGITPDRKSECSAQLCYLPNRGDFYDSISERNGISFDPSTVWASEITAKKQLIADHKKALEIIQNETTERRAKLTLTLDASGTPDLIGAFNDVYSVQEILLNNQYSQRGNTFRHQNSESGSYSASVKDGRVHSLSSADPLYTGGGGVGAHDAFSAFRVLQHQGNMNAALKDAGDNWLIIGGESWNKVKQRDYMHSKSIAEANFEMISELKELKVENQGIPFDIEYPPGLLGAMAEYIYSSSRMPVRSFAVAGALSALAHLNDNRWFVKGSDTPLNLYQTLVGGTGKGKEDPRKAIKRIALTFARSKGLCESIASGPALLRALEANQTIMMLTDEFGIFLQVALADKGNTHLKELVKELLTLFGLGRSFFAGKVYADSKMNIPKIDNPYVNVLGTTTQLELLDGVTSKSVDNGFLNRFLFVMASEENHVNRSPVTEMPKSLIDGLSNSIMFDIDAPLYQSLHYEEGALDLMVQLAEQMTESGDFANLWSRAEEQMIRVAGLLAIGDGCVIKRDHIMWAYQYVTWCIKSLSLCLGSELAESVFEKRIVKAKHFIENAKQYVADKQFGDICKLGYMPVGKLTKLMKIPARELGDVTQYLLTTQQVKGADYKVATDAKEIKVLHLA